MAEILLTTLTKYLAQISSMCLSCHLLLAIRGFSGKLFAFPVAKGEVLLGLLITGLGFF